MEINSLKINNFKGLFDLPDLNFSKINIITSPGNFGKTSIIQAIVTVMNFDGGNHILKTANIFKNSRCRDFDYFKQLMRKENDGYIYDISAVFESTEIRKRLYGEFLKGQKFSGEYYGKLTDEKLSLNREICNFVEFSRNAQEIYKDSGIICPDFALFDFERTSVCPVTDYRDSSLKDSLINYLICFEDIEDFKISDRKFYIKHKEYGVMPSETLGSAIYKCVEFSNFCDKNKCEMLFVENLDTVYSPENHEMLSRMIAFHILKNGGQVFITLRNRSFGKVLASTFASAVAPESVCIIDLKRGDDGIAVENKEIHID